MFFKHFCFLEIYSRALGLSNIYNLIFPGSAAVAQLAVNSFLSLLSV